MKDEFEFVIRMADDEVLRSILDRSDKEHEQLQERQQFIERAQKELQESHEKMHREFWKDIDTRLDELNCLPKGYGKKTHGLKIQHGVLFSYDRQKHEERKPGFIQKIFGFDL